MRFRNTTAGLPSYETSHSLPGRSYAGSTPAALIMLPQPALRGHDMRAHLFTFALLTAAACGAPCETERKPAPAVLDLAPPADLTPAECVPCSQSLPDAGPPMGCLPSLCVRTVSGALCCVGTGDGQ